MSFLFFFISFWWYRPRDVFFCDICISYVTQALQHFPIAKIATHAPSPLTLGYCRTTRLEKGTANLNCEMFINVFHNFITFQATRFRKFVRKSALRRVYFFLQILPFLNCDTCFGRRLYCSLSWCSRGHSRCTAGRLTSHVHVVCGQTIIAV